jgi:hypothetical protein
MKQVWEYHVSQFGTAFTAAKPEKVEVFLNQAAAEGWELDQVAAMSGGSKLMVILRRRIAERARKKSKSWP